MKFKQKYYEITEDILSAFEINPPLNNIDINGMIEDMCTADDTTQMRMVGYFLYKCIQHETACLDFHNLSWFAMSLSPLSKDVPECYRIQRLQFLYKFSSRQIRLIIFVFMTINKDVIFDSAMVDFIHFWIERYIELCVQETL